MTDKKRYILVAFLAIVIAAAIAVFVVFRSQRSSNWVEVAFETADCPEPLKLEPYPQSYQGVLIDTHIHIPAIPDGPVPSFIKSIRPLLGVNSTIADFICMFDNDGITKAFAFFPVWDPIRNESLDIAKRAAEKYPDRFMPFIMPPDNDNDANGFPTVEASTLEEMLSAHPNFFKGYGEIGLYERQGGAKALLPDSARLLEIYPVIRKNKLVVYFHLGEGQKESFEKVLEQNRDITFIWHGDQLVNGSGVGQDLSKIEEILSNHPNVYYGVDELWGDVWLIKPGETKENFLAHFKDYEDLLKKDVATWKSFIERHPDQVIWGSDRGVGTLWSTDLEVGERLNHYVRAFIGRLDPSVQEKYAYQNAEKIFEGK